MRFLCLILVACTSHHDALTPDAATPVTPSGHKLPPDFAAGDKTAIFVEIAREDVTLTIDVAAKVATIAAHMDIVVHQPQGGAPLLDVVPAAAKTVAVDGGAAVALATVTSPDGTSTMRMVDQALTPGPHALAFPAYRLKTGKAANGTELEGIAFPTAGGFAFQTEQDDTAVRSFSERYFPSGFEADTYPLTLTVKVENAAAAQQPDVMTNGTTTRTGNTFTIQFPANDSTSCWFVHVLDRARFKVATAMYDNRVPLTVYAPTQADANLALADAKVFLAELERDYGPYPHPQLVAAINTTPNDPEEYEGAVASDLDATEATPADRGALGHELLHQWFGRSARPFQGRDGWVDEAIAEWRDDGYPRATEVTLTGTFVPLALASPYQRQTPDASYAQGSLVMQDLDYLLRDRGGLKPVLRAFREQLANTLYTTEDFLAFLDEKLPDLAPQIDDIFRAKVYAGATVP